MGKTSRVFSKALSVILAMAMVMTCVPASAYAANLYSDGNGEILSAESSHDVKTSDILSQDDDATLKDNSDVINTPDVLRGEGSGGNTEGREEIEPDKTTGDVTITFVNAPSDSHVHIYDPDSGDARTELKSVEWDSSRDFTCMLTPDMGYVLDEDRSVTVKAGEEDVIKDPTGYTYDPETGSVIISRIVLESKKGTFTVTVPSNITKADSYKVTVTGTTMPVSEYPTVSYDTREAKIDLSEYEIEGSPITDVEVYAGEEILTEGYSFENKVVTLNNTAIVKGYQAEKSLNIKAVTRKFAISSVEDKFGNTLTFKQNGKAITESTDYDHDIEAELTTPRDVVGRTITSITAAITYEDGTERTKVYKSPLVISKDDLVLEGLKAVSVEVTVKTQEVIDSTTGAGIGTKVTECPAVAETGGRIEFEVHASESDTRVKSVGYKTGISSEVIMLDLNMDGIYAVSDITNKITIVTEAEYTGNDTVVKADSAEFTIYDNETRDKISGSGTKYAKTGEPYYFKVVPNATGALLKEVTYTIAGTSRAAEPVEGNIFMVPADRAEGEITIKAVSYSTKKVIVPVNTKAVVYYNGVLQPGDFYIRDDQDVTLTVKGSQRADDGKIALLVVKYTIANGGKHEEKELDFASSYDIKILKDELKGDVTIEASTAEEAKEGTYSVKFNADDNGRIKVIEGAQTLLVAQNETTVITPTVTAGGKEQTLYGATYESKSGGKTVIDVEDEAESWGASVKGISQSSDEVTAELLSGSEKGNVVVYKADLKVEVMPHFVIGFNPDDAPFFVDTELAEAQGTGTKAEIAKTEKADGTRKTLAVTVINGATGKKYGELPEGVKSTYSSSNAAFYTTEKPYISVMLASEAAGTSEINAVITDTDGTEYTAEAPCAVKAVDGVKYFCYATVTIDGVETLCLDEPSYHYYLNAEIRPEALVRFRVVEVINEVSCSTLEEIEQAIANGNFIDLTDKAVISYEFDNSEEKPLTYISLDEMSKGTYLVAVNDEGPDTKLYITATVDNIEVKGCADLKFSASGSAARVQIGVATNDEEEVVMLPASYLDGKDYSRGYIKGEDNNGYSFKVPVGTMFTLPDEAENPDAKRILLGWEYDGKKLMPGQAIEVPAENSVVTPIWGDRYVNDEGIITTAAYRNTEGELKEEQVVGYELRNNIPTAITETVSVPVNTAENKITDTQNNKFSINGKEEKGVPIDVAFTQNIGTEYFPGAKVTREVCPAPAAVKTAGMVKYYVYDGDGSDIGPGKKYADAYKAAEAVTIVDKEALDNGYIKGAKAGNGMLFAVFTDETGYEWVTPATPVTVEDRPSYELAFSDKMPSEIAVDEEIAAESVVSLTIDGEPADIPVGSVVSYTVTGVTGDAELLDAVSGEAEDVIVRGIKEGTVKVAVSLTDANDVTVTGQEKEITVKPCPYKISIVDKDGNDKKSPAEVAVGSDSEAGPDIERDIYIKVTDAGTGASVIDKENPFSIKNSAVFVDGNFENVNTNTGLWRFSGKANDAAAVTEDFEMTYKDEAGKVYTFSAPVKSYFPLVFDGVGAIMVSDNPDKKFVGSDNVTVQGKGGRSYDDGKKYELRIYAEDINKEGLFTCDLSGFSATYTGQATDVEFAGWTGTDGVATPLAEVVTELAEEPDKDMTVYPEFMWAGVKSMILSRDSVEIEVTDLEKTESAEIEVSTTPVRSEADVLIYPSVVVKDSIDGFFGFSENVKEFEKEQNVYYVTGAVEGSSVRKSTFSVVTKPGMVGTATLKLSADNSDITKNVSVNIYGLYTTDDGIRYVTKEGNDVAGKAVKAGGQIMYFDADGYKFADDYAGPAWDEEGKPVLLRDGNRITADGFYTDADTSGNSYFVKDGHIVTSSLVKVGDIEMYADPDGAIVTYARTVNGKYTDPVTGITYVIDKETNAAKEEHKDHKWKFEGFTWAADNKSATGTFICEECGEKTDAVVTMTSNIRGEGADAITMYTATVAADPAGKEIYESANKYVKADGSEATEAEYKKAGTGGGSDGQYTPCEPTQPDGRENINIFYNNSGDNVVIKLPDPAEGTVDPARINPKDRWTKFWYYENGTAVLKGGANRSQAAKSNTVILPLVDDEGKEIGDYEYTMPVTFDKPVLKLSTKSGKVYTSNTEDQTITTQVLEKKSNGLFEPLDLSEADEKILWTTKKGTASAEVGVAEEGIINITAKEAAGGTISIRLADWSDMVKLDFTVTAQKNDTLTATKQVLMNTNANSGTGEPLVAEVLLNGRTVTAEDGVRVEFPNNWNNVNVAVEGVDENGTLEEGGLLTFSYKDSAPVKGNYTIKLSRGKARTSIKVSVSNMSLDKAITLKQHTQLNPVTDQKMVLVPTLKGVDGAITDVRFGEDEKQFEAEYDELRNQILIGLQDGKAMGPKDKAERILYITAGGIECPVKVKIQPKLTKPKVKIDNLKLPKSGLMNGTATGTVNVLSTYKLGFKTYGLEPVSVKFTNGVADEELGEGWYRVDKAYVSVKYNEDEGTISVKALKGNSGGKGGSVKVEVNYNGGVTLKKTFSVKVDSKK